MKKGFILLLSAGLLIACKKNDTSDKTAPLLTLNGRQNDTVTVGTSYTDPGAVANDNKDGDITAQIVVSGEINTAVTGNYTKEYNVHDAAGNAADPKTRRVRVRNEADPLNGTYFVSCHCATIQASGTQEEDYDFTTNVVASASVNKQVSIGFMDGTGAGPVTYNLRAENATISGSIPHGNVSGTYVPGYPTFTLNVNLTFSSPSRQYTCSNVYIKE